MRKLTYLMAPVAVLMISLVVFPGHAWAQSATVTDDGFVSSSVMTQYLNLNGQGISLIVAGSSATVGTTQIGTTKTFIKFQLSSSLPPNIAAANVSKATLKLYLSPATNPTGAIDIYPVTSAWSESTLTTAPPTVAPTAFATGVAVNKANSFLVIDVTQLVQQWLNGSANGGLDNDGIAIEANTAATHVVFDSKESVVTSHEPRLEIVLVHSGPAGAAATVQVGSTTTVGAGGSAAVTNSGTSSAAVFNFAIPQGQPGAPGQTGPAGQAATISVGPTVTLSPGAPASVLTGGTPNAPILNFLIPQGAIGAPGLQGPQGPAGLTNRGGWNISTNYSVNDAVTDGGSYWLALVASGPATSNSCQPAWPPDPCSQDWQRLATGINNKGVWAAGTNYRVNDAVSDLGSFWLATVSNTCEPAFPPDPCSANWQLLAAKGAVGAQGAPGSQGPQGIPGMGIQGPPGPMPVGAALVTAPNTFAGSQTVNGSLILGGVGSGVKFADGTLQTTAAIGSSGGGTSGTISCSTFEITSASPVAPPGYVPLGTVSAGNTWSLVAPMPTARGNFALATDASGAFYVMGGENTPNQVPPLSVVEKYDPVNDAWSTAASMPTARWGLGAATDAQGNIYAMGGYANGAALDTVEKYDPVANTWSAVASMPTARFGLAVATDFQGNIYAIGGHTSGAQVNTVEMYNPATNTWSTLPSMPTPRYDLAAATDGQGNIYAVGGFKDNVAFGQNALGTVEMYNPTTNSWTIQASMPTPRYSLAATTDANGNILAIGGRDINRYVVNTVEAYNPTNGSWSAGVNMLVGVYSVAAATDFKGNIYVISARKTQKYWAPVTIYTFIKN